VEITRQIASRPREEFSRSDAPVAGWNTTPRPKVDNRAGDLSKLRMVLTGSIDRLGSQTRFSSRNFNAGGNTLTRDGSCQNSRTANTGIATTSSATSTYSSEYHHPLL
jgi:hypothetical protein